MDSMRVHVQRTGLFSTQAATPITGWTPRSSLPPKPPPQAVGMMRTDSFGMPMICATSSRSIYGAWVDTVISSRSPTRRAQPASGSI